MLTCQCALVLSTVRCESVFIQMLTFQVSFSQRSFMFVTLRFDALSLCTNDVSAKWTVKRSSVSLWVKRHIQGNADPVTLVS